MGKYVLFRHHLLSLDLVLSLIALLFSILGLRSHCWSMSTVSEVLSAVPGLQPGGFCTSFCSLVTLYPVPEPPLPTAQNLETLASYVGAVTV